MNIKQLTFNYIIGMSMGIIIMALLDNTEQRVLDTCKTYAKVELAGVTVVCATKADILAKYKESSHV